jgi:opacity protein-like surface antigen
MKTLISCSILLASQLTCAATPVNGWYASIFGGFLYQPDNISKTYNLLQYTDASYHGGFDAGGNFGFKSTPLRYEVELSYLEASVDTFRLNTIKQTNTKGSTDGLFAMANVYYDFPGIVSTIEPYLGVGLGFGEVHADLKEHDTYGSRLSGSSSVFSYQAMGGFTYNFEENWAASLGYRYLATERVDALGKIFQGHMANVGLTYRFDEVRYK